jgi:hypothetical protein
MKRFLIALLLLPVLAHAQQGSVSIIPDCSLGYCSGLGVPGFKCNSGQRYAQVDNPGINFTCTGMPPHWVQDAGGGILALSSPHSTINLGGAINNTTLDINLAQANTWTNGMTIRNGLTADQVAISADGVGFTFLQDSQIYEDPTEGLFMLDNKGGGVQSNGGSLQLQNVCANLIANRGDGTNNFNILQLSGCGSSQAMYEAAANQSVAFFGTNDGIGNMDSSNTYETQIGAAAVTGGGTIPGAFVPSVGIGNVTTTIKNTKINLVGQTTASGKLNSILNYCSATGIKCDGATDDTAALQTFLTAVAAAGGGTIQGPCGKTSLLLGQVTIPSAATTPWAMSPLRITGCGASFGSANSLTSGPPGNAFTIDARFAGSRIISLGQGVLEIDHVVFVNGGSSCGAFFQTTLTNFKWHDNAFYGSIANGGGINACDDVWIAGGTNGTNIPLAGTTSDFFQGYGSVVDSNFADYIRSFITGRVAFDGIPVVTNTIWKNSGSNVTTAITAATNATAAVLTSTGHSFPTGTGVTLTFSGFTGSWVTLNGIHAITVIDANTFSVPINSSAFGALTGAPVYLSGAAITVDGTAATGTSFLNTGNALSNNLIEQSNYPFVYKLGFSGGNYISGSNTYDITPTSIATVWQQTGATSSFIQLSRSGTAIGVLSQTGPTGNGSLIFNVGQANSPIQSIIPGTASVFGALAVFQPLLATNNALVAQIGTAGSSFNNMEFFFKNGGGTGSTSNTANLGMQGGPAMSVDGLGHVTETSVSVGGGTSLTRYARFAVALTPAAVAANTCVAQSFTVTGVLAGDFLIGTSKPTEQAGLSVDNGHVSAANTATLNFCNNTAASITPTAAELYQFVVVE